MAKIPTIHAIDSCLRTGTRNGCSSHSLDQCYVNWDDDNGIEKIAEGYSLSTAECPERFCGSWLPVDIEEDQVPATVS
ncbi:hypothetical protein BC938DRAFT_471696 [Jimgerdemannia flammicorona]|uniref:Uncharacterized protein n=1 Tax=Jimgerdemannia flammicorona TaxID=994334 RepID=A0A433Q7K1_9FUNG|nr:hypothetical protein BC938DRAFT_471696 [Jimgerdemannia flammicorona]